MASMTSGPVATVLPRPILKHQHLTDIERPSSSPPSTHAAERHAHFGATEITQRFSGIEYDRTPIVVCANALDLSSCRRSPGRTFDELDAHYYKQKKCVRYMDADELIVGAAAALERLNRPIAPLVESDALNLPALVHTDTSDSEAEDEMLSSSATESRYPRRLCRLRTRLSSSPPNGGREPKRLKKAHNSGKLSRTTAHESVSLDDSSFASCPGVTSCLGGF